MAIEKPISPEEHDHDHGLEAEEGTDESPKYAHVTSRIAARKDGGREIYIYLNPCDHLEFRDGETHIQVDVNMEGHRHWTVSLAPGDVLGTGRPDDPPPITGGGG